LRRWYGQQRLLRFASLADHPSLRAAGEALGIGCSQLVDQVRLLEEDLGGKLIIRGRPHRPMHLTPLGEQVIAAIRELNGR
jgi:DNA-binding transcriptional LysR family regulator